MAFQDDIQGELGDSIIRYFDVIIHNIVSHAYMNKMAWLYIICTMQSNKVIVNETIDVDDKTMQISLSSMTKFAGHGLF